MSARIIAACRSAVAPQNGAFAHLALHEIAAPVVRALLHQTDIASDRVDEIIVSNALGAGGNPSRRVALAAGLPNRIAGVSLDRQCAGGMDSLLLAKALVESGAADVVVAGGVESYSRRPLRAHTFANGARPEPYDQAPFTPWPDRDPDMAQAANDLGKQLGISRTDQDEWAVTSHANAAKHVDHSDEIVPLAGCIRDPFTRRLSLRICARATPFAGDITPANAAVAADGAAFCLVVAPHIAKGQTGMHFQGKTLGGAPECPGIAPLIAIEEVFAQTQIAPRDLSTIEMMEAYAVQAIACVRGAVLDPALVNTGGGALARGHPIGASGAINAVRLFHDLQRRGGTGLAAIAAAGGIGTAMIMRAP